MCLSIEKTGNKSDLTIQLSNELFSINETEFSKDTDRISYITDLHLNDRIKNANCQSDKDIFNVFRNIILNIISDRSKLTLIGGDVASKFEYFELFVKMLRYATNKFFCKNQFVFVLGNHEFWEFPDLPLEKIVEKYRKLLTEQGMYLLHNDLLYKNNTDKLEIIHYNELMQSDNTILLEKLRCSRLLILGGTGFSGYNKKFNADSGMYKETINRIQEIQESKKFENLYNKLSDLLDTKNTVILTHMPMQGWCKNKHYHEKFVYVSGHTHRNDFYDNNVTRIYSNNQIGYHNENPHMKSFSINNKYDYFSDYKDGIYEITPQEYQDFICGKNMDMNFNRQGNIYMLKKNGYYCFIFKLKSGSLSILNKGALKKLEQKDIQYYYDNMDTMVAFIKNPLDKYTIYQESISNEIKKIGGSGKIHGCIIDIDYSNHIFVNPTDMSITGYWAKDIVHKKAYPNIPILLKEKCPNLYSNYQDLINNNSLALLIEKPKDNLELLPQEYLGTDIYKPSTEIKKMQLLNSNILTAWYDIPPEKNILLDNNTDSKTYDITTL